MPSYRQSGSFAFIRDTLFKIVQLQQPDGRYQTHQVEEHAWAEPQHHTPCQLHIFEANQKTPVRNKRM